MKNHLKISLVLLLAMAVCQYNCASSKYDLYYPRSSVQSPYRSYGRNYSLSSYDLLNLNEKDLKLSIDKMYANVKIKGNEIESTLIAMEATDLFQSLTSPLLDEIDALLVSIKTSSIDPVTGTQGIFDLKSIEDDALVKKANFIEQKTIYEEAVITLTIQADLASPDLTIANEALVSLQAAAVAMETCITEMISLALNAIAIANPLVPGETITAAYGALNSADTSVFSDIAALGTITSINLDSHLTFLNATLDDAGLYQALVCNVADAIQATLVSLRQSVSLLDFICNIPASLLYTIDGQLGIQRAAQDVIAKSLQILAKVPGLVELVYDIVYNAERIQLISIKSSQAALRIQKLASGKATSFFAPKGYGY